MPQNGLGLWVSLPNVSTYTGPHFVNPVSSDMPLFDSWLMHPRCSSIIASARFCMRRAQPRTRRYMIISVLMNMRGTGCVSACTFVHYLAWHMVFGHAAMWAMALRGNVLLMSVRTDDTRFISRAFMLASSRWPPKPGSTLPVHPTVARVSGCCNWKMVCARGV